jgi:hypothetical protein
MSNRRKSAIAAAAIVVLGGTLAAGIAVGEARSNAQAPPPQLGDPGVSQRSGTPTATKPKAQAFVHFEADGTILGPSKKVVAVHHYQTGGYCIELDKSIRVGDQTYAIAFVDYFYPTAAATVQMYSYSGWCAVDKGFPNSVAVLPLTSTRGQTDAAMYFLVP